MEIPAQKMPSVGIPFKSANTQKALQLESRILELAGLRPSIDFNVFDVPVDLNTPQAEWIHTI